MTNSLLITATITIDTAKVLTHNTLHCMLPSVNSVLSVGQHVALKAHAWRHNVGRLSKLEQQRGFYSVNRTNYVT